MAHTASRVRKVVLIVSPDYLHDKETNTFAARIKPLGLTAYGDSQDKASSKVKRMFASAVAAHRLKGNLEQWLTESGLEWHWLDEYEGNVPVEDTWPSSNRQSTFRQNQEPIHWQDYDILGVAA